MLGGAERQRLNRHRRVITAAGDEVAAVHDPQVRHIMRAVEASLPDRSTRTRDLGGTATTEQAGAAIVKLFEKV